MKGASKDRKRAAMPRSAVLRRRAIVIGLFATTICGVPDVTLERYLQNAGLLQSGLAAHAGSRDSDRLRELQEKAAERAREMAERAAERAREQAERAAERAREQAERAAERAREQAERAAERARAQAATGRVQSNRDVSASKSDDDTPSSQPANSPVSSGQSAKSESSDSKAAKSDTAAAKADRKSVADKDDNDVAPPDSVADWFKRLNGTDAGRKAAQRPAEAIPPATAKPAPPQQQAKAPPAAQPSKALPAIQPATAPAAVAAKKAAPRTPQAAQLEALPFRAAPATEVLAINPDASAIARARSLGFTAQQTTALPQLDMSVVRLTPPPGMDAVTARQVLGQQSPKDQFALNQIYRPIRAASEREAGAAPSLAATRPAGTDGCGKDRCYGMAAIRWQPALQSCSSDVKIGIVDTMIDQRHPALRDGIQAKRIDVRAFSGEGRRPAASAHGTSVLSLLAGAPQSGTPGLAPEARYLAADIFHADSSGQPFADSLSLLRALNWMEKEGVKIVNMSVAGPHDETMERAIEKLARKGMIFVAAAGNEGPSSPPVYPAAYRSVIAVTAVSKDLRGYRQANRGEYIDMAAPGVEVWAAVPDARESYQSGTSFAVPFATAVLATVYGQVPTKSKDAMLAALEYKDLGLPGRDPIYGRGLVLAPPSCTPAPAVEMARSSGPAFSMAPAGVGASSITFGYASGKP